MMHQCEAWLQPDETGEGLECMVKVDGQVWGPRPLALPDTAGMSDDEAWSVIEEAARHECQAMLDLLLGRAS